jgi:hypothetical protein
MKLLPLLRNLETQPSDVLKMVSPDVCGLARGKNLSLLKLSTTSIVGELILAEM